jgi:hypothetical protein
MGWRGGIMRRCRLFPAFFDLAPATRAQFFPRCDKFEKPNNISQMPSKPGPVTIPGD